MDLLFNKRLGFVEEGRDVDGILATFRNTGWIIGVIAAFPYLLGPIIHLPMLKSFLLPHSGDSKGIGKVMTVSIRNHTKLIFADPRIA